MIGIGLGLPQPGGNALDYAAGGYQPAMVADFARGNYRKAGVGCAFDSLLTSTASTNGTLVNSAGTVVWRAHNLALNSAAPATQGITVISGAQYTVECTGSGSVVLSGAGTGTVTAGSPVSVTASTTTLTLTVSGGPSTMWAYRSDLGGMAPNPDTGTSYVPTTGSAVYMPRRGHHVYSNGAWVNAGCLIETEARTNLAIQSQNFTTADWTRSSIGVTPDAIQCPVGLASKVIPTTTPAAFVELYPTTINIVSGTTYCGGYLLKAGELRYAQLISSASAYATYAVNFDLQSGVITYNSAGVPAGLVPLGNGWYYCWVSVVATATVAHGRIALNCIATATSTRGQVEAFNGTDGLYVGYHQHEAGSTPSSYIPTLGATATRGADGALTVAGADMPWPTPTYIGSELVTNGDNEAAVVTTTPTRGSLSQSTDYAQGGSYSAKFTADGSTSGSHYLYAMSSLSASKTYLIEAWVYIPAAWSGSGLKIIDTNDGSWRTATVNTRDAWVKLSGIRAAKGSAWTVVVGQNDSENVAGQICYIDNISVREINPLAVSIAVKGRMTYADEGAAGQVVFARWQLDANNRITLDMDTDGAATGEVNVEQAASATVDTVVSSTTAYAPGINVPFSIASRHGTTFINGAVGGTALTADLTPVALPALSATSFQIGYAFMGTIESVRVWADDIGNTGIASVSA